jgi:hypothetical protein
LLVGLGLLLLAPLVLLLAFTMLRVETPTGTLLVELNGADTEARVRDGKLILTGADGKDHYTLSPRQHDNKIEAGSYKVHVEGGDGLTLDTTEFTLKKGGAVTVKVTAAPNRAAGSNAAAMNIDPDREAAEWVLSIGGKVRVNAQPREITAAADLPPEAFRVTMVWLHENTKVSDAGLAHFKDCKDVMDLNLRGTKTTDAGLAHFKECKNLTNLGLFGTRMSDAGLANFKDCKSLSALNVENTQVGDAGLANLKDCNLTRVYLGNTKMTDAGLDQFKNYKNLSVLHLQNTKVSDRGLGLLKDCKELKNLDLRGTKVTAAKIIELKKALPNCKIRGGGGVIQP